MKLTKDRILMEMIREFRDTLIPVGDSLDAEKYTELDMAYIIQLIRLLSDQSNQILDRVQLMEEHYETKTG